MFWIPMAIGAGAGLLKNKTDKERADRMNQAASVQTAYSPHSGMGAGQITQAPSGLEGAMQGAMTGAMMGKAMGGEAATASPSTGTATATAIPAAPMAPAMTASTAQANPLLNAGYMNQNPSRMYGHEWMANMNRP